MPQPFPNSTENKNRTNRNLCNFTTSIRYVKLQGFFIFWLLPCSLVFGQSPELFKFQQERTGNDGQVYIFEGMTDEKGTVVIPADYDYIWGFGSDTATIARKRYWNQLARVMDIQYQLISKGGFLIYEYPYNLIPEPVSEGLIRTFNSTLQTFGYTDLTGNRFIKYKFREARDFSEGKAAVRDGKTGLFGFINKKGNFIFEPLYTEAFSFSEGKAVVKKNGRYYYCLPDGKEIPIQGNYTRVFDLKEGFSVVANDSAYGFIDKGGNEILPPKFVFLDNFDKGIAVFVDHNDAGMINTKGEVVIEARYDELYRFDQDHYLFQKNGMKGLLNTNGEIAINAQYSAIDYFSEGLAPVLRSGKWGFAGVEGTEVIPAQFAEYRAGFKDGKIDVRLSDKWMLAHGKDTLNLPDYDEVLPFYGLCAGFRRNQLWGFLNQQGEESIEPKFDELVFNKGSIVFGRIPLKDGSFRYSFINSSGREVGPGKYIEVTRFSEGYAAVRTEKGWGFVDTNGLEVISPQFTSVRNFSSGRAAVYKNGNWSFITTNGKEVIPSFTKMPSFGSEPVGKTYQDTLKSIRESFPLFRMQVVGDFDEVGACVEDETMDNDSVRPLFINKTGKINPDVDCTPLNKLADVFNPETELNFAYTVLRAPGRWITIDRLGNAK